MTDEQIAERIRTVSFYINKYIAAKKSDGFNIELNVDNAATSIVALYERYAEGIVRKAILSSTDTIHHYKIISNTELSVLRVSPIEYKENRIQEKKFNAELAFELGLGILIEWNNFNEEKIRLILKEDSNISNFLEEHFQWLCLIDTRSQFPIFSNAQVWRLFSYLIIDRLK